MRFQKGLPVEAGRECLRSASTGPLKSMDASPPVQRSGWQYFEHLRTMARAER
jgi:hypothetical protein